MKKEKKKVKELINGNCQKALSQHTHTQSGLFLSPLKQQI